jgi:hypothetical protein
MFLISIVNKETAGMTIGKENKFVAVTVKHPETGITGVHYVEVQANLVYPEKWAASQERERGFEVIDTQVWEQRQ